MSLPRLVDEGERFPIEMKTALEGALQILRDLTSVPYGDVFQKLNFAYEELKLWKYRFSSVRRDGETTCLSEGNAERVYQALDRAWERFVASTGEHCSIDGFISQALATFQSIINGRELDQAKDIFIARAKELYHVDVTVAYSMDAQRLPLPKLETFLQYCIEEVSNVEALPLMCE